MNQESFDMSTYIVQTQWTQCFGCNIVNDLLDSLKFGNAFFERYIEHSSLTAYTYTECASAGAGARVGVATPRGEPQLSGGRKTYVA